MVERRLAKAEVAGSSPVSRSTYEMEGTTYPRFINRRHSQAVRQRSAKPSSPVRFRVAPPKRSTCKAGASFFSLSKKWITPFSRDFHGSLAPKARPGSHAGNPLLRKVFCGFAAHPPGGLLLSLRNHLPCVAKSDANRRGGAEPSAACGGRSEANAQCARALKEAAFAATRNNHCELHCGPRPQGLFDSLKEAPANFEYLGNGTCPGEIHSPCAKGSFAANARRMQKRRPAVRGPGLVRQLSLAGKTKIGKRPLWLVDFRFHPPRKTKGCILERNRQS